MNEIDKSVRTITGRVVSNKMDKSISVEVERLVPHRVYGKYVKRTSKLMAHDEGNECHEGDLVEIKASRPISKNKAWILHRIVEKVR
ncbi:30S ribosomal protein S17 [Methylococcales bacterium]|nr:30S ribosomal protein S17 [Methylococcales bacterium]